PSRARRRRRWPSGRRQAPYPGGGAGQGAVRAPSPIRSSGRLAQGQSLYAIDPLLDLDRIGASALPSLEQNRRDAPGSGFGEDGVQRHRQVETLLQDGGRLARADGVDAELEQVVVQVAGLDLRS